MTLRAISIGSEAPVTTPVDQEIPHLEWIEIDRIVVDETYQCPLSDENWRAIRRIAASFTWQKFSPIMLAPAGDRRFAVIDGQHRTHAALLCGKVAVPAMIVRMTRIEQAAAFAAINGDVIGMSPFHVYRAALAAGEDWAVTSRDAVARAGCVLMDYNKSTADKRPGEVYAINLIRRLVEAGRADLVTHALLPLVKCSYSSIDLFATRILGPWCDAVFDHGLKVSQTRLCLFVEDNDLVGIQQQASEIARSEEYQGGSVVEITRKMFAAYLKHFSASGAT